MSRVVYVNGSYRPWGQAAIHAEDRGFQFADAIYEVIEVSDGRLIDETRHLDRFERSRRALELPELMSRPALQRVIRETVRRNRVENGSVYMQLSRGAKPRDFLFPAEGTPPTFVCVARRVSQAKIDARAAKGIAVKTAPDIRWQKNDIKTVMLLPASLAKVAAKRDGADDAWFVDKDGKVTEGASSTAWIVDDKGRLVTRELSPALLPGITRRTLLDLLAREGIEVVERAFTVEEAKRAREAFTTSATSLVMPVVSIDGSSVGNGAPGILTMKLRAAFHEVAERARF